MGAKYEDKWHTPKHIKIERAGEPRGSRRGSRKKKDRRKGSKARMDEIISVKKCAEQYYKWARTDKHLFGEDFIHESYIIRHTQAVQTLRELLKKALKDDIITRKGAEHVQKGICIL